MSSGENHHRLPVQIGQLPGKNHRGHAGRISPEWRDPSSPSWRRFRLRLCNPRLSLEQDEQRADEGN